MKSNLAIRTLVNTLAAAVYVFGVSQLMVRGDRWFGELDNTNLGPFAFLLLFSLSAAVVGGLVFGPAAFLFLAGNKKESIQAALLSTAWLFLITVLVFLYLFIRS